MTPTFARRNFFWSHPLMRSCLSSLSSIIFFWFSWRIYGQIFQLISYKYSISQNYYADHLSVFFYLDRINRIFQDFFAFPEERQKPISLFEGVHLGIQIEQRNDMSIWQKYHRPLRLSFPAESGVAPSRFHPEIEKAIDPINLARPVGQRSYWG